VWGEESERDREDGGREGEGKRGRCVSERQRDSGFLVYRRLRVNVVLIAERKEVRDDVRRTVRSKADKAAIRNCQMKSEQ